MLYKRLPYIYFSFIIVIVTACQPKNHIPASIEEASELVWIKGGKYNMGREGIEGASPIVEQEIQGFWIQKYEVTNAQFSEFVKQTNYISVAEKNGGSYVFSTNSITDSFSIPGANWWKFTKSANWKNPQGENITSKINDFLPASHIAYEDACAYCDWLQMRLPTEAEWEFGAKESDGSNAKNIWQGNFPFENKNTDGFERSAPVGSFPANKNGLYDIQGNVWEWCSDYYNAYWYNMASEIPIEKRIQGPEKPYDPSTPYKTTRVIRGGSFLCAESYCTGYLPYTRMRSSIEMTFEHIGFRCVKDNISYTFVFLK